MRQMAFEKEKNKPNYFKYGIPIALGVGGIVAAPFLLGALGGKNKKLRFGLEYNKLWIEYNFI